MGIVKQCEYCGCEFTVPPSLAHIRTCSTVCGYKVRKINVEACRRGGVIGGSKLRGRKFPGRLNSGCFKQGSKINLGRKRPDMKGKQNPFYRMSAEQRLARAQKHSQSIRGRKNPKHSEYLKKYYAVHPEKHPNSIMARSQKHGVGYVSRGQMMLYLEIKNVCPEAVLNYPIKTTAGNLYFADIAIPSPKIIVEYDGSYWHKGKEKMDTIRDFNLQADGWKIYRIKESEYKQATRMPLVRGQDVTYGESVVKIQGLRTS